MIYKLNIKKNFTKSKVRYIIPAKCVCVHCVCEDNIDGNYWKTKSRPETRTWTF